VRLRGPAWLHEIPRPIRSGHRGAAGLVVANTLRSYAEAVRLGCDLVEVDVQPTSDGTLVLLHDNTITIDGMSRPVAALSLAELQQAAPDVPTLAQALALLGDQAIPLLDLKGAGFEAQLGAAVQQAGVHRAIVCGQPLSSLLATQRAKSGSGDVLDPRRERPGGYRRFHRGCHTNGRGNRELRPTYGGECWPLSCAGHHGDRLDCG